MPCSPSMYVIELRHAPVFPKPGSNVTIPVFARSWLMSTATSSSVPRRTGSADRLPSHTISAASRAFAPLVWVAIARCSAAGMGEDRLWGRVGARVKVESRRERTMPYGPRGIYRLIPSLTWQCDEQVSRVLSRVGAGARIADLGAGGRRITPATICLDFAAGQGTDGVGDVQRLPFRDASLDLVFATGLLEHVEDERLVLSEIARVLRTGGLVHVEIPFLEQYHEDPI